jgi:S-DNA-T family DNA segregation ATPase FtsK/SpoIIIE
MTDPTGDGPALPDNGRADLVPTGHEHDAETVPAEPAQLGGPVDPPDEPRPVYATVVARRDEPRRPIVPAWLRNHDQRVQVARWAADTTWYVARFHATRSPKYAAKTLLWALLGLFLTTGRLLKWAAATEHTWSLMQHAASGNDAETWLKVDGRRERHARWRWPVLAGGAAVVLVAVLVLRSPLVPWWAQWAALAVAVPALAWVSRPPDKPITDRTVTGPRFVKLTGEMVRRAVVDLGIGVKELGQITFPPPGVHRDGPGWLARFNLPGALLATKVMEKRAGLAASMRLPIDQVWPEVGPDHPGQVDLWVGYAPSSKMGQPTWALASPTARTSIFETNPFATDARQRPISTVLFERNFLIGGQPGSGKTYGARTLATIAMLDPICELKIAEFKGTGDFLDMEPLCSTYACGLDDEAFDTGAQIIAWALVECERRGKRIKRAKERGDAPQGKITPELAAKPGSGLHPVFILLDEVHELFAARPEVAAAAERAIRRGRALGIILVLATQIPDKDSVPPNITRCVTVRWCMSVGGQVENDMILGTGAYKRGLTGTVYRPGHDAGWGVVVGLEKPGAVRSFFPDPPTTAAIVARAVQLRGGLVDAQTERIAARDMLADARAVLQPGEAGLPWQVLAERLAELAPDVYAGVTADMVRESLARYGVQSQDVKVGRSNIKGARRTALDAAEGRREIGAG